MGTAVRLGLLGMFWLGCLAGIGRAEKADRPAAFTLKLRSRVETTPGSGQYHTRVQQTTWQAPKTAVIVCDMWDQHGCAPAAARVAEMAPRANQFLIEARRRGALIVHCPSDTMDFYRDTPQRRLAQQAPPVEPPVPLQRWCHRVPDREPPLPIDDSDSGCEEPSLNKRVWTRQIATLEIHPGDAITDSLEAYYLLRQRQIENVMVLGVHTNRCVLGRPFGIRQLVLQGFNVALVRDLTDSLYNPARPPHVSHFTGTDLVVEHIETWWCPSITSADLLGGGEFRFKADTRPTLLMVSAEDEYRTEHTLPEFARKHLGHSFRVQWVFADAQQRHLLPGLEALEQADVLLLSVRRRALPAEQMAILRRFLAAKKPLVAIRTSSHAFALRSNEKLPADRVVWPRFDADVLGCNYQGHYGNDQLPQVRLHTEHAEHPILRGVEPFVSGSSLYRSRPLAEGAVPLLIGRAAEHPEEPVAWTYTPPGGGRVFYTSLGGPGDFQQESFQRLLRNAVHWAAGVPLPPQHP